MYILGGTSEYRNAFNHRFTPNQIDNRAKTKVSIEDDGKEISFGNGKEISRLYFYNDMEALMGYLSNFMKKMIENFESDNN